MYIYSNFINHLYIYLYFIDGIDVQMLKQPPAMTNIIWIITRLQW